MESNTTDIKKDGETATSNTSSSVDIENKSSSEITHCEVAKPKAPKTKKRKRPKDTTAPKAPLSGYIRYLNDRREAVRKGNPNLSFTEITRILATEWTNLQADKKQLYLDAAEQDKERYNKEYEAYKQTDAYRQFTQQQQEKKLKEMKDKEKEDLKITVSNMIAQPTVLKEESDFGNFDIPIFTEEFLDHNKTRDAELRQLRKTNTDYEQQNAILVKHIENMKSAITKLETQIMLQEKANNLLLQRLNQNRITLAKGFVGVKLPGIKESATLQNIDNFMTNLHSILESNKDTVLEQSVKEIISKMEFTG